MATSTLRIIKTRKLGIETFFVIDRLTGQNTMFLSEFGARQYAQRYILPSSLASKVKVEEVPFFIQSEGITGHPDELLLDIERLKQKARIN